LKLLSINVSLPVEVEYNNKIISTGIFKKPVEGTVHISPLGLSNDEQVDLKNHGGEHKAIYAFSAHHYAFWRNKLNRPDLSFGQFGENLTIADLDETSLCIGDQIQIADCILEITQPRVPCYKLGIALGQTEMPKFFVKHGATGIYFRVLQAGTIDINSQISILFRHPKQLTVHTLFNAYFDKNFSGSDKIMALAEAIPQLSNEWRNKVLTRL
jgi:MOSC domain-containing protein YiiM